MAIELMADDDVDASGVPDLSRVRQACIAALQAADLPEVEPVLCVRIVGDAEMRRLNHHWLDTDAPTDVLAFPMQGDGHYDFAAPLGDIVLAWPYVTRQAASLRLRVADHALHLIVHGLLHLVGYDHSRQSDARRMRECERQAMRLLGLCDPYAQEEDAHA